MAAEELDDVKLDYLPCMRANTNESSIWSQDKHRVLKCIAANNIKYHVDAPAFGETHYLLVYNFF